MRLLDVRPRVLPHRMAATSSARLDHDRDPARSCRSVGWTKVAIDTKVQYRPIDGSRRLLPDVTMLRIPRRPGCAARGIRDPPHDGRPVHENPMSDTRPLVSVVDDDESVRESLPDLLRVCGYRAEGFASAEAFLASGLAGETRCLILDVAMPGMFGPGLQRELARRRREIPIVFVTAHHDEADLPRLLAAGAVACLFKPFGEQALLAAVAKAIRAG
jgi:CheY-like chemotaxis protein